MTKDLSAQFGTALLPVMSTLAGMFQRVAAFAAQHPGIFQVLIGVLAALAATIVVVNIALAIMAALEASVLLPVLAIVAGLAALIAIGVLLWKNWDRIKAAADAVWAAIKNSVSAVLQWLRANWPKIAAILAGPLGIAVLLIVRYWSKISGAARTAVDAVKSAFSGLVGFFKGIVSKVATQIGKVVDAIKTPINAVIGAWNDLAFTIPRVAIPSWVPKIGGKGFGPLTVDFPDIPKLAAGGIVTRPTVALLGETGPEAVVPLGRAGAPIVVNVETLVVRDDADIRRIVAQLSAAVAVRS